MLLTGLAIPLHSPFLNVELCSASAARRQGRHPLLPDLSGFLGAEFACTSTFPLLLVWGLALITLITTSPIPGSFLTHAPSRKFHPPLFVHRYFILSVVPIPSFRFAGHRATAGQSCSEPSIGRLCTNTRDTKETSAQI